MRRSSASDAVRHTKTASSTDIKNILIDKEGPCRSFGIARVANSQTMNQDTETVMGSALYFSQAKGA